MKRLLAAIAAVITTAALIAACGGKTTTTTVTAAATHTVTATATTGTPAAGQRVYTTPYGLSAHSPTFGKPPAGFKLLPPATGVQTLAMYDSVNANVLPSGARVYAGYTSGWWPTAGPIAVRFPNAKVITIAVNTSHYAQCLDVEPGDASPSEVAGWIAADRAHGFSKPCVYSSLSEWGQIRAVVSSSTLAGVFKWDANWTYSPHIDAGYQATQWTDHYNGTNVDASMVTLDFAGLGATPNVPPKPPNVMHYERYDNRLRRFGKTTARERSTVRTWDRAKCENPVRRSTCKSSRNHTQKLRGRLLGLHASGHAWSYGSPSSIGVRNQQLWHRLNAKKPIRSWAAGA